MEFVYRAETIWTHFWAFLYRGTAVVGHPATVCDRRVGVTFLKSRFASRYTAAVPRGRVGFNAFFCLEMLQLQLACGLNPLRVSDSANYVL